MNHPRRTNSPPEPRSKTVRKVITLSDREAQMLEELIREGEFRSASAAFSYFLRRYYEAYKLREKLSTEEKS